MKTYSAFVHLNGNLLVSVDLETTGRRAGFHEPIQIAVVPLNSDIRPLEGVTPFYTTIKPLFPERAEKGAAAVHGIDLNELILHSPEPGRVADNLLEWWEKLDLPFTKSCAPLAHNWAFESAFLNAWLGLDMANKLFFGGEARDSMLHARSLNDRAAFRGESVPFPKIGLGAMCKQLKVTNPNPHDALCDALAEAEVYRSMIHMDFI